MDANCFFLVLVFVMNNENDYVAMLDIFLENWHSLFYSSEAMGEFLVFSIPDYHFRFHDRKSFSSQLYFP